jgi:hypothetical protein
MRWWGENILALARNRIPIVQPGIFRFYPSGFIILYNSILKTFRGCCSIGFGVCSNDVYAEGRFIQEFPNGRGR